MTSDKVKICLIFLCFLMFSHEVLATWTPSSVVVPVDRLANDALGSVVDIDGEWALAGVPVRSSKAGGAYVFHRDESTGKFVEYKKLVPSEALVANDNFGFSVAVDGNYMAVGSFGRAKNVGAVYLFAKDQGGVDNWGFLKKITITGGVKNDYFGRAIDIDGDKLAVSAYGADGTRGAGYVFEKDQGGVDNWGLVKKLVASDRTTGDYLGDTIAISGENVVIGSYRDNSGAGSVYLFSKNRGGENNYGEVKRLVASDAVASAYFGSALDIDGEDIAVGAYRMNSKKGAVYIFSKDQGGSENYGQVKKLVGSDTLINDVFGYSLKLNGGKLAVGAEGKASAAGAVYLFDKNQGGEGSWGQVWKSPIDGVLTADNMGWDVSVNDGWVVAGVPGSDTSSVSNGGSLRFYKYNTPPMVNAVVGLQNETDKKMKISYQVSDVDGDEVMFEALEYSLNEGVSWIRMEGSAFENGTFSGTGETLALYDFCGSYAGSVQNVSLRARVKDAVDTGDWKNADSKVLVDCKAPIISNLKASQKAGGDKVEFSYDLADDSEVNLVELMLSADGGESWDVAIASAVGDLGEKVDVGVAKKIEWDAGADLAGADNTNMMFKLRATDKYSNVSDYVSSGAFSLDTKAPVVIGESNLSSTSSVNVEVEWDSIEDSNFGFYKIWYGTDAEIVKSHGEGSKVWSKDEDLALSTLIAGKTTVTGLDYDTKYYFEIWAFDAFGHASLISEMSIMTPSQTVQTQTVYQDREVYVYLQSSVSAPYSVINNKPETIEVPESVQVVDGVFRVPEDLKAATSQVFEIKDDLNNLSLFIPGDAEITLGGKEKFYGNIFKPVIKPGAPLVSEEISSDILLTISADTSAEESVYFSKPVIVTFDLEKALNGVALDKEKLIVYFYDKTKEKYDYVSDLAVSLDGKTAAFLTYHFSTFVVMQDSVATSPLVNNAVPFEDVAGHWSQSYVETLYSEGVVDGKGYRSFAPAEVISRAEFLKIVLMAFGYSVEETDFSLNYSDVSKNHWAYNFIGLADGLGLVEGYGAGIFKPDAQISRAEALKILVTVSGLAEKLEEYKGVSKFLDVGDEDWYLPYLNFAFEKEVVAGYGNGLFGPGNSLTRAEAAKMVVKMLGLKSS